MRTREGEHPGGDTGQLALLGLFLAVWIPDSFVWRATTRLGSRVPLALRLVLLGALLGTSVILVRSGHRAIDHRHRDGGLVTAGLFAFYDRIASFEERWLEDRHGEAYPAYRQRTGKWWPRR